MQQKTNTSMQKLFKRRQAALALAMVLAPTLIYGQTQSGMLDPTFGAGGKVVTSFGGNLDWAASLVVQPDGKVVAAGQTTVNGLTDFALARYSANGTLDPTFGTGGK